MMESLTQKDKDRRVLGGRDKAQPLSLEGGREGLGVQSPGDRQRTVQGRGGGTTTAGGTYIRQGCTDHLK